MCGRDLMHDVPMVRLDPQYKVLFGEHGGDLVCTPSLHKMAEEVGKLNAADGKNVARFIAENRVKLEKLPPRTRDARSTELDVTCSVPGT